MANQLAIRVLARPGTEVLCQDRAHVYRYEAAAGPLNSAVQMHPLWSMPDGITAAIEGTAHHMPTASLLVIENTYMPASGAPIASEEIHQLCERAHAGGLAVHVDGARIWNASVALDTSPAELCADAETVMFCLSKGLSAPVGSVLCGSAITIDEARAHRSRLGGGMRQAGIIAAAGIVALETMVERLADDHVRARRLAEAMAERWPGSVAPEEVHTNIVCAAIDRVPDAILERLGAQGIQAGTIDPRTVRFVTHKDVDDDAIARTIKAFDELGDAPRARY
jgi:threonine aldolase